MGIELNGYKARVDQTIPRIKALQDVTSKVSLLITAAQFGVKKYKTADKTAEKIDDSLFTVDNLLTVVGFVSPLKTPVKVLKEVLKRIEPPIDKIDDKFDEISGKDDTSTPGTEGEGGLVANVETSLTVAALTIAGAQDTLTLRLRQFEIASEATGNYVEALAVATRGAEVWSDDYIALNAAIEAQMAERNALTASIESLYTSVQAEVDAFLKVLEDIDFQKILGELVDLEEIGKIFDFLKTPLAIAEGLLAPIQPLLNAVDFLVGLIVNPIIDFVIDTLNLDSILDATEAAIDALIPSINLLDAFENLIQPLQDLLLEYIVDGLGTIPFLDTVESAFFGNVVGEADQGPTGWGNDVANLLAGDGGDDILDALDGNDTILGGGGNDVIIAGAGSDFLDGGAGDDLFYFGASFTEYELARDPGTDEIIVSHLAPQTSVNTGIDVLATLDDTDHVVFTDISFTGAELNNALIGGSILNGDQSGFAEDDLMFLNSSGTPVAGFHVANGLGGNDRIFGSTLNDQLNGGSGNDVLLPGLGDDEANGGSGTDTFQVLRGANSRLRVDLIDGTSFGQGQDTLSSIENVVASPNQDHQVRGTDGPNAIYTGDGIDVISGLDGDDTIDAGGEDDYIIGGRGADVINAGAGNIDVMISGSAAQSGVSDHYIGGDGFDLVSYTSSSNTIRFDINDQSDDPSILQKLRDYMEGIEASGPVQIDAGTGRITRLDLAGNVITTDTTDGVEGFMGSDLGDTILGAPGADLLHGGGGDDVIRTGGTENIDGGEGDDLIFAEEIDGGSTALQIEGGAGFDRLRLDDVGDARWFYRVESAISLTLRAHKTTVVGEDLRNAGDVFFSIKPRGVEEISLGDFDDHAIYEPGGSSTAVFFLRGGNDRFDGENGFADVHAGAGNDIGNFNGGGGGIFRGEAGDDFAIFDDAGSDNAAIMGVGSDFVQIERFRGNADGGDGYDTISFDVNFSSRIVADLAAGTVVSFKGVSVINAEQVGMTLQNFEMLIATEFNDLIDGSSLSEQLLGRGGSDTIRGAGGSDKLYGGAGNDTLEGGAGDDLLHGGGGNDRLDGGQDNDTVSYAWARPDGIKGAVIADVFGAVIVDLATNSATGTFGADTLLSIENVIGTGADDRLTGDQFNNMLSGGAGNDSLEGAGGDDILITGAGNDTVSGGAGDDTIVVGLGNKVLDAGGGVDTLDFGTVTGSIELNLGAGSYVGTLIDQAPRWAERDLDGDGVAESDGTEARLFNGVALTPEDVFEADPSNSNSLDDVSRVLPELADEAFAAFQIELIDIDRPVSGSIAGFERVTGGDSDDALVGDSSANQLSGAAGQDLLSGLSGDDTINGGDGDDTLSGGDGNDELDGGDGHDNISGSDGDDMVTGGLGNDSLGGGLDNDTLIGGDGDDVMGAGFGDDSMSGGNGHDVVAGGAGVDTLEGGAGNDSMSGSFGDDLVSGGGGDDDIGGGTGRDTIDAGAGNDSVGGGEGDDSISGGGGNDFLAGGGRHDVIDGGAGNDTINAGAGNDDITGGLGADQFVFSAFNSGETDVIRDFEDGVDSFFIRIINPDTGEANISNGGNGLAGFVAALGIVDTVAGAQMNVNGHQVLVEGMAAADLTIADFSFL